ncbi:MAG TPA: amidohydrolase family protein [Candidatus Binatia bacterium]|nr:amidohydrolase family protein [Candidatus Binatia bacterium]
MRVDVHAHYYHSTYIDRLARNGADTRPAIRAPGAAVTFEQRVELLDGAGIRVQVLSVGALQPCFANAEEGTAAARLSNDVYADVCQKYGGRFSAFATVPLPHIDAALTELARAIDLLGMVGVNLGCSIAGRTLDDPAFVPFFDELNRRGMVVFLHPVGCGCGPFLEDLGLDFPLGAPFEDSIAAMRLVLAGVIHRFPKIRFIVPHLGGTLPFLITRLDNSSVARRWEYKPSQYLKRLWYDSINGNVAALRCAREAFGADRLVLGTDFPHLARERFNQCVSYVEESDLPQEEKHAILDRNAQALLGLAER